MSSSTNEVLLVRALAIAVVPDGPMLLLVMCNTLRVLVFVIPSDSNSAPWSPSLLLCMFNFSKQIIISTVRSFLPMYNTLTVEVLITAVEISLTY